MEHNNQERSGFQQDYALLMGAIALFVALAIVMYVTRKVDWYARDAS
jgi:inner membrane protein involved in colicin E2 resistance